MVDIESLKALSAQYGSQLAQTDFVNLRSWANEHGAARADSLLDAAAIGFAFDVIFSEPVINTSKITPEMKHAWELAYPEIPAESLNGQALDSLTDNIRGWKGRLFGIEAVERLNRGSWVGDLHLKAGQHVECCASTSQSGWNLHITDDEGIAANKNQLKAVELLKGFHDALERFSGTLMFASLESAPSLNTRIEALGGDGPSDSVGFLSTATTTSLSIRVIAAIAKVLAGGAPADGHRQVATATRTIGTSVLASAFSEAFSVLFNRSTPNSELKKSSEPEPANYAPNLTRLRASASRLTELVRTFEPLYPCPERERKLNPRCYINDYDELLLLVDSSSRLAIQRGSTPLDQWITLVVERDTFIMSEAVLRHHLSDLLQIKADNLVDKAFCGDGFLIRWESAMSGGRMRLEEKLKDAIEISNLSLKKYNRTFSEADARKIQYLKTTAWDKTELKSQGHLERIYKECG